MPIEFNNESVNQVTFDYLELDKIYYVSEVDEKGKSINEGMTDNGEKYKIEVR